MSSRRFISVKSYVYFHFDLEIKIWSTAILIACIVKRNKRNNVSEFVRSPIASCVFTISNLHQIFRHN